ncbi:MAG: fasciclin domain-containing protein [Bacteroidota bacterium]|nr:fasciclin domain-containing protein [Bacteroidota bacterium]
MMKFNQTWKPLLINALIFFGLTACNQNAETNDQGSVEATSLEQSSEKDLGQAAVEDETSDPNILKVAIGSEPHSTLVAAVQAADIEHILVNAGPLTVFAPTNAGFDKLPEGTVEDLLKPENKEKLATILKSHAAPGNYDIEALKKEAEKGRPIFMASGDYWEVTTQDGKVYIQGVEILGSVKASNGIIHVIDQVILPQ